MKRIGVTQRVSTSFHGQPHDCLDQAWADLFTALECELAPLPNLDAPPDKIAAYLESIGLDAIVLSGGNDIAGLDKEARGSQAFPRRDRFERAAIAFARARALPLLGVCRGMQILNLELAGKLTPVEGHAGTRHKVKRSVESPPDWFDALPDETEVNSYHTYAIAPDGLAPELRSAAIDVDGYVEAFFHPDEPMAAIMWHPEREGTLSETDRRLMTTLFSFK